MSKIDDGGPAFPGGEFEPQHGSSNDREPWNAGMTLRDHFASQELPAIIAAIRKALEAGPTPGEWTVWEERVSNKADAAAELVYQVECTDDFAGAVYLLNAGGKCPAETGCGPTSKKNAAFIASCNPVAMTAVLAEIDRLKAENERMRAALEPFAAFCGLAEGFVQARAEQGGSPVLPTKHFSLAHFRAARAALKGDTHGN